MEFLSRNLINTTTQISVPSGTLTVSNIYNPDIRRQWVSAGANDDLITASVVVAFNETVSVSRIGLQEINVKGLDIFYNGATANAFALTSTGATSTSQFSNNSESSLYMRATPVNCTSVTFDFKTTMVADAEKAIGQILLGNVLLDFDQIPSAKNYKPKIDPRQIQHELSDGGVRIITVQNKMRSTIKFKYIDETFRDSLKEIYDRDDSFVFVPFGTMTGWDKIMADVVWPGSFDFYQFSDNAAASGFSGQIPLRETS